MGNRFNLTLFLVLALLIASCTTIRKSKSSESRTVDSTQQTSVDTTRAATFDSTNDNAKASVVWWQRDTTTTDEQTTTTETITETSYDTAGRKTGEKKTERTANTQRQRQAKTEAGKAVELAVAHTGIHTEDVQAGKSEKLTKVVKREQVNNKQKKVTMFPWWLILVALAGAAVWLYRRYKQFV